MKIVTINGKAKEPTLCKTCKGGKIFEAEEIRTQKFASPIREDICGECNTKYINGRKDAKILIGKDCNICDNKVYDQELNFLCECNITDMSIRIVNEISEVSKMDDKTVERIRVDKGIFDLTGVCPSHMWIDSKPVRLVTGEVIFQVCPICQLARVTSEGKTYEDKLMKLVTFMSDRALKEDKKVKNAEKISKELGKQVKADCLETSEFQFYPEKQFDLGDIDFRF